METGWTLASQTKASSRNYMRTTHSSNLSRIPAWRRVETLTSYTFYYIKQSIPTNTKPLEWIGSSFKDLVALPPDVRRFFGFALSLAQAGDKHDAAKVLKGFGGACVLEVLEDDRTGTYRAVLHREVC